MPARDSRGTSSKSLIVSANDLTVRVDTPGGPGGQHANRTKSRVTVELDLRTATSFDEETRARLRAALGDVVRSSSSASRSQAGNRRAAEERLARRVQAALEVPVPRGKTRPTKSAVERRLESKRRRGSIKRLRTDLDD